MKVAVSFEIDTERLDGCTDAYLAQLWHVAQANPAPHGDADASNLVQHLGTEIIRRWLHSKGAALHRHQPNAHYWTALIGLGAKVVDGAWTIAKADGEGANKCATTR
jgi:hypothetical protein